MDFQTYIIVFIALIFSALFSGLEIAFIASNKLKIELDRKAGSFRAKLISYLGQQPSRFISSMLVGNNIALVIYGLMMAAILEPFINQFVEQDSLMIAIQTIISTVIVLFFAEFTPKTIFRLNANAMLGFFALPALIFYKLLQPIVWLIMTITNAFLTLSTGKKVDEESASFGRLDFDEYLNEVQNDDNNGLEVENEVQFLKNALDFSKIKARECMIPRTEIVAIPETGTVEELIDLFFRTGLSKIIVYRENIDDIIGYVHSFEMFKSPACIKDILRPISVIPETMTANQIMQLLIKQKRSIVVVVDEYGGTSGLIALEDIVEEIFGDIEDEHDTDELLEKKIDEGVYRFSARLEIDYLNESFDLGLPSSDEYETLAGLILYHHEDIPDVNEVIELDDFSFKILKLDENRVDLVELEKKLPN